MARRLLVASHKFFVVITEEGFPSRVTTVDTVEEMKAIIKGLLTGKGQLSALQVHAFHGEQWKITTGPMPYLLPPNHLHTKQSVPLFDTPQPGLVDEEGFLGTSNEDQDPDYLKVTKAAVRAKGGSADPNLDSPFDN